MSTAPDQQRERKRQNQSLDVRQEVNQKPQKKCRALPNVVQVTTQQCLFVTKHTLNATATANVLQTILNVQGPVINPMEDLLLLLLLVVVVQ